MTSCLAFWWNHQCIIRLDFLNSCPLLLLSFWKLISMQRQQYDLLKVVCQIAANWAACNQAQCEYILTCVFPALCWVPKDLWQPKASLNTNKVSTGTVGKDMCTYTPNRSSVSRMTQQPHLYISVKSYLTVTASGAVIFDQLYNASAHKHVLVLFMHVSMRKHHRSSYWAWHMFTQKHKAWSCMTAGF